MLYHGNTDLKKIYEDLKRKTSSEDRFPSALIMHVTNDTNKKYALTKEDYDSIIEQYKILLEEFYQHVALMGVPLRKYHGLYSFFMRGLRYEWRNLLNRNLKVEFPKRVLLSVITMKVSRNRFEFARMSVLGGACVKSKEHLLMFLHV